MGEAAGRGASVAPDQGAEALPPIPTPPWAGQRARRPRRAARPSLDRTQIVAAALRIVDAEGTDALTLRRLAETLGVTAMSLYWHVRDKGELLELVGQAVLAEIEIPPARGDWREQIFDLHRAMLIGVLRHPNALDVLVGRARYGAAGVTMFERLLTILLDAGLSSEAAFDAYMVLYEYLLGFVTVARRTPEFIEIQRQGVLYLHTLPAGRFPSIARIAPVIGHRSPEQQFEIGLRALIAGIAETLAPSQKRPEVGTS